MGDIIQIFFLDRCDTLKLIENSETWKKFNSDTVLVMKLHSHNKVTENCKTCHSISIESNYIIHAIATMDLEKVIHYQLVYDLNRYNIVPNDHIKENLKTLCFGRLGLEKKCYFDDKEDFFFSVEDLNLTRHFKINQYGMNLRTQMLPFQAIGNESYLDVTLNALLALTTIQNSLKTKSNDVLISKINQILNNFNVKPVSLPLLDIFSKEFDHYGIFRPDPLMTLIEICNISPLLKEACLTNQFKILECISCKFQKEIILDSPSYNVEIRKYEMPSFVLETMVKNELIRETMENQICSNPLCQLRSGEKTPHKVQNKFEFPRVLVIHVEKFRYGNDDSHIPRKIFQQVDFSKVMHIRSEQYKIKSIIFHDGSNKYGGIYAIDISVTKKKWKRLYNGKISDIKIPAKCGTIFIYEKYEK